MPDVRVNMINRVNPKTIRIENVEGEPHLIIPSYTLPDSVQMNGGMYPKEEIDRAWPTLEGTMAPIGHPTNNAGEWVSAFSATAIHNFHGGAFNRNVRRDGHRVYAEKVVNIRYALQTEPGKRLLEAVRYNAETGTVEGPTAPIHTSTGLLLQQEPAPAGAPYKWVARNMRLDHDAILLDEPGAATPEQGVGLMVNCSEAVEVQNLSDDSYQAREQALAQVITARFGSDSWVRDFDQSAVVFRSPDGGFLQIDYRITESGAVELNGDPVEVQAKTSWVKTVIANLWARVAPSKAPITNQSGEDENMPLSQDDLQAIGTLIGNKIAEAVQPVTERLEKQGEAITSLQTNSDLLAAQLKTNREQQVAIDKALVASKHGDLIANSVAQEKLAELAQAIRDGETGGELPDGQRQQNNSDQGEWGQVPGAQGGK